VIAKIEVIYNFFTKYGSPAPAPKAKERFRHCFSGKERNPLGA
jgi:hypothetical protein